MYIFSLALHANIHYGLCTTECCPFRLSVYLFVAIMCPRGICYIARAHCTTHKINMVMNRNMMILTKLVLIRVPVHTLLWIYYEVFLLRLIEQ